MRYKSDTNKVFVESNYCLLSERFGVVGSLVLGGRACSGEEFGASASSFSEFSGSKWM